MFFSTAAEPESAWQVPHVSSVPGSSRQQPTYWAQQGVFGYSVLKKASPTASKSCCAC